MRILPKSRTVVIETTDILEPVRPPPAIDAPTAAQFQAYQRPSERFCPKLGRTNNPEDFVIRDPN